MSSTPKTFTPKYRNFRVRAIAFWLAWTIAILGRQTELRAVLPILRYCEKVGEEEDPTEANASMGAPTTTLEQWSRKQVTGLRFFRFLPDEFGRDGAWKSEDP